MNEQLQNVLNQYDIKVEYTEKISDKLIKLYTDQGTFGLKRLANTRNKAFTKNLTLIEQSGYSQFVPIYSNKYGKQFTSDEKYSYYLIPWLQVVTEEERNDRHNHMFKEIAELHSKTVKEVKINKVEIKSIHEKLKNKWQVNKETYEKFVSACEANWYMSPFELQAVSYFNETSRATDFAIEKLDAWAEIMSEKDDTRIVLTHRHLSTHHFLFDQHGSGYLTNFEKSDYSAPIDEMILFYLRSLKTYPSECEECVEWFYSYQSIFPYREEEMNLYLSYLAYPANIYRIIESYKENQRSTSQLAHCTKLIENHWLFKNIEYLVHRISEVENQKKAEKESQSST